MLVDGWQCNQNMLHVVGADAMSLFAVFANGELCEWERAKMCVLFYKVAWLLCTCSGLALDLRAFAALLWCPATS